MWNIAICDDESAISAGLRSTLTENFGEKIGKIEEFADEETLLFYLQDDRNHTDIIFMDIQLADSNGIDLAKKIHAIQPEMQIIFISGYDNYYLDVYDVEHIFFLKKPIEEARLRDAFLRAGEKVDRGKRERLTVSSRRGVWSYYLRDIVFFEKDKRKIIIHSLMDEKSYYETFDDLMPRLNELFVRCHNSYIVNLAKVDSMEQGHFNMAGGITIPISRTYCNEAKHAFIDFLERRL